MFLGMFWVDTCQWQKVNCTIFRDKVKNLKDEGKTYGLLKKPELFSLTIRVLGILLRSQIRHLMKSTVF